MSPNGEGSHHRGMKIDPYKANMVISLIAAALAIVALILP
jgi:hypothetical protein